MGRGARSRIPFSGSDELAAEGFFADRRHLPHPQPFFSGADATAAEGSVSFSAKAAVTAAASTTVTNARDEAFSLRLTFDAVVDGAEELDAVVMMDEAAA